MRVEWLGLVAIESARVSVAGLQALIAWQAGSGGQSRCDRVGQHFVYAWSRKGTQEYCVPEW